MATTAAFSIVDVIELETVTGGWWEGATTYDPKSGHYVSTDDYKRTYGVDQVCQSASCYDAKSGHFIDGDMWNERERDRKR